MKNIFTQILVLLLSSFLNFSCTESSSNNLITEKFSANDPFIESIVESQYFEINANEDNVIEGDAGTTIVIQKGSFQDENGNEVEGPVKIELAEALSVSDMILSNLTTTSNGEMLETGGMIYFQTTQNGKQVFINEQKPLYIEIPTKDKKPEMSVYEGRRDENGNMNWINPQPIASFLTPIGLDQLNFYPDSLEYIIAQGLPFKKHDTISKFLVDSLYGAMKYFNARNQPNIEYLNPNEPYESVKEAILSGYLRMDTVIYPIQSWKDSAVEERVTEEVCGIDPTLILELKNEDFQNTFVATKEFERRLQSVFKSSNDEILMVYLNNLDKNLWECDSLVANKLKEFPLEGEFRKFADEKCTTVQNPTPNVGLLLGHYRKRWRKTNKELKALEHKAKKLKDAKGKEFDKDLIKYKKLLFKREKHRMETYGFEYTKTGWINVDKGVVEKNYLRKGLEVTVSSPVILDRAHTYILFKSIKSLYRLNTDDNTVFFMGNRERKSLLTPSDAEAVVVSLGYAGDSLYVGMVTINTMETQLNIDLSKSNKLSLIRMLQPYENWGKENSISVDMEFQKTLFQEKKRRKKDWEELFFLISVWNKANYGCDILASGIVDVSF